MIAHTSQTPKFPAFAVRCPFYFVCTYNYKYEAGLIGHQTKIETIPTLLHTDSATKTLLSSVLPNGLVVMVEFVG